MKPHWITQIDAKLWPRRIIDEKAESSKEIAKAFGVSLTTAKFKIRQMIKNGTLEKVAKFGNSNQLTPAYRPKKK